MQDSSLSKFDTKLIDLLKKDARQSSDSMARELGVSSSTIRRHIDRLVDTEAIRFAVLPNPKKIGLPLTAILALDVATDKLKEVTSTLSEREEVQWLSVTSGRYDVIGIVWFPSTEELFHFMEEIIGKIEGIRNSETFISLHVEKRRSYAAK